MNRELVENYVLKKIIKNNFHFLERNEVSFEYSNHPKFENLVQVRMKVKYKEFDRTYVCVVDSVNFFESDLDELCNPSDLALDYDYFCPNGYKISLEDTKKYLMEWNTKPWWKRIFS